MNACTRFWASASTGGGMVGVGSSVASLVGDGMRPTGSVAVGRGVGAGRGVAVGVATPDAQAAAASVSQASSAPQINRVRIMPATLAQAAALVERRRSHAKNARRRNFCAWRSLRLCVRF